MIDNVRITNTIRHLKSLIQEEVYYHLIEEKVKWVYAQGLTVGLVESGLAIKEIRIKGGGKVVWDETKLPQKIPIDFRINILDFNGVKLLAILLHECGHVMDKDDPNIELETKESEMSAWKHAIEDFNGVKSSKNGKDDFASMVRLGLSSYQCSEKEIQEVLKSVHHEI